MKFSKIEVEDRIPPEEKLTTRERFNIAEMILNFDKIKPYYEKSKNYQTEIDQYLKLGYQITDEEQRSRIFEELKRFMIEKLGCKEEWFEEAFMRQIEQAQIEQVKQEREAKQRSINNPLKN